MAKGSETLGGFKGESLGSSVLAVQGLDFSAPDLKFGVHVWKFIQQRTGMTYFTSSNSYGKMNTGSQITR